MKPDSKRVLIVTAVPAEKDAVLCGLSDTDRFDVLAVGVGPVAAAVNTAKALAGKDYDLVISAGIGGGFTGRAEVGSLVVADKIVAADLGAETAEGFCSLDKMGLGSSSIDVDVVMTEKLANAFTAANLPVTVGPVLTLSTVTGTQNSAEEMAKRVPEAAAEAMEGFGAAVAAVSFGLPVIELRAVSNLVGPRDRPAWKLEEAFNLLTKAAAVLTEVL